MNEPMSAATAGARIFLRTVAIPAGALETSNLAGSRRAVSVRAFRLGATPVTNRQYAGFLASGLAAQPPWWRDTAFSAPAQPVVGVTWDEANAYCQWLGERVAGGWRLPTEAEWEYAACGGLASPRTTWGETIPSGEIPEGPLEAPWETGRGTPNGYGLLDMGTIVHEWCSNWSERQPPTGPRRRAARGGSWRHQIRWSSPSAASSLPPQYRYSDFGFRVLAETPKRTG